MPTKIPNVAIHIPGNLTSFTKFAPRYCLKLYQALWKGAIKDPMDPVRIIATPAGTPADMLTRTIEDDNACDTEAARLRSEFGLHKSGEPLFDVVYPADTFEAAFAAAQRIATAFASEKDKLTDIAALDGVGAVNAKKLFEAGYETVASIANADPETIAKLIGKGRAAKAHADATAKTPVPAAEDGLSTVEPEPQIVE